MQAAETARVSCSPACGRKSAASPVIRCTCALAHSMADVQDDVHQELRWDLLALAAADGLTDEGAARAGVASPVAGFYPSLHLNLGECYRKLGETDEARGHLAKGLAAVEHLGDDGYGQTIKDALVALSERLDAP